MKKNCLTLSALLTIGIALAGCSGDGNPDIPNTPAELRLTSSLDVQTRATHQLDTQLKNGEPIHVWVDDAVTDKELYADNAQTVGDNGTLTGGETMYFPGTGNGVDIYAIHGNWGSSALADFWDAEQTHSVAQDQRTGQATDGYALSDLVYVKKTDVTRTKQAVNLEFKHLLSKVEVILVRESAALDIEKVEILHTKLEAKFTPDKAEDGIEVTAGGAEGENPIEIDTDLTSQTDAAGTDESKKALNEAIIVPQTLVAGTSFIRITTTGGVKLVYNLPEEKTFAPATKYRYIITAKLAGLEVTAEITDWTGGNTYSGDAIMQ